MANYEYRLRAEEIAGSGREIHTGYGVELWKLGERVELIRYARDVFCDMVEAQRFVDLCNSLSISPLHFDDVIEDAIS